MYGKESYKIITLILLVLHECVSTYEECPLKEVKLQSLHAVWAMTECLLIRRVCLRDVKK